MRVQSGGSDMKSDVVVHVWKSQADEVAKFAGDGFHVVFSSCWYLDRLHYGPHWIKYYQCYPCTPYAYWPSRLRLHYSFNCSFGELILILLL